jgi:thioredoxin-related protein
MPARRRLLGAAALAALPWQALRTQEPGREAQLARIDDLRPLLAAVRTTRAPLLVLFSTPGCPFCREVRESYLAPRLAEQAALSSPNLLIREVDITGRAMLTDATGVRLREAEFAARYRVRVVPVVTLLGGRGEPLVEPLVGIDRSGFYEAYLARAIDEAQRALRP